MTPTGSHFPTTPTGPSPLQLGLPQQSTPLQPQLSRTLEAQSGITLLESSSPTPLSNLTLQPGTPLQSPLLSNLTLQPSGTPLQSPLLSGTLQSLPSGSPLELSGSQSQLSGTSPLELQLSGTSPLLSGTPQTQQSLTQQQSGITPLESQQSGLQQLSGLSPTSGGNTMQSQQSLTLQTQQGLSPTSDIKTILPSGAELRSISPSSGLPLEDGVSVTAGELPFMSPISSAGGSPAVKPILMRSPGSIGLSIGLMSPGFMSPPGSPGFLSPPGSPSSVFSSEDGATRPGKKEEKELKEKVLAPRLRRRNSFAVLPGLGSKPAALIRDARQEQRRNVRAKIRGGCRLTFRVTEHDFHAHHHTVNEVTWSLDERRVASCSHDKTVRLWEPQTGSCVRTLVGHEDAVMGAAFSEDGLRPGPQ